MQQEPASSPAAGCSARLEFLKFLIPFSTPFLLGITASFPMMLSIPLISAWQRNLYVSKFPTPYICR